MSSPQPPPPLRLTHLLIVLAGGAAGGCFVAELADPVYPEMGRRILTPSTQEALPDWPLRAWATVGASVAFVAWLLGARWLRRRMQGDYLEALRRDAFSFLPLCAFYLIFLTYVDRSLAPELTYFPFFLIPLALPASVAWKLSLAPASTMDGRRAGWVLGLGVATFVATFATLNSLQIHSVNVPFTDSGYFERMLWNICRGNLLHCCEHDHLFLGTRVRFVQFLLVPIYVFWRSLYTLTLVQTLAVGLGAIPVFLLSKRVLEDNRLALACAAAYLLHPATQYLVSDAGGEIVRLGTLGLPASLLALLWLERRRHVAATLAFAFTLTCREEYALVLAAAGVYLLLRWRELRPHDAARSRRDGWFGLGFLLVGIAWFLLALFVVIPHFRGEAFGGFKYYRHLGSGGVNVTHALITKPGAILAAMFTPAKIGFLLLLVVPLCLFPVCALKQLLLALPPTAICLLSERYQVASILFHYHAPILPYVFLALPFGANAMLRSVGRYAHSPASCARGMAWALVVASLVSCSLAGKSPLSPSFYDRDSAYHYTNQYVSTPRTAEARRLMRSISRDASVCATEFLATQFTHHANCWTFPNHTDSADLVVVDTHDRWLKGSDDAKRQLQQLLASPHWQLASARQNILVLRKHATHNTKHAPPCPTPTTTPVPKSP